MICNVCGGSQSYIHDGVEYCRECSTQFTGSREEESSEESFSKKSLLSSPSVKKVAKDKKKHFAPWISVEAYNLILSKQVTALIKLGCSEKLKTVVLYIWALYLQKCEVAFKDSFDNEANLPHLSAFALKRDIQLLYGDGRAEKKFKQSSKNKKQTSKKKEPLKLLDKVKEEEESIDSEMYSDNFSIQNNELNTDTSLSDFSDDTVSTLYNSGSKNQTKKPNYSSHVRKMMKTRKEKVDLEKKETCVHHMTLSKTLSFCQLGLLYTTDQLLLFDLLRLANEGVIPYIDVTRHFPTSMQLQANDIQCFTKHSTPKMKTISLMSAKLIDFLALPELKHPPLLPIASRFVKDLNLPNDVLRVAKILINRLEDKRNVWRPCRKKNILYNPIPPYEVHAICVIIVSLKMLLVLDGQFELEQSEVMTKLNSIVEDDKFFIWDEWRKQTSLKEYLFVKSGIFHVDMSRIDSLSADRICGDYLFPCLRPELFELACNETKMDNSARITIKNILEELTNNNDLKGRSTSFPLQYQLQRLMTEWKRLPMYKETKDMDFSFINKDFSRHKLYYRPCKGNSSSDDLCKCLFSSLYVSEKLFKGYSEIKTSRRYWAANITAKNLKTDNEEKWLEDLPSSFKWLLKFLCKYIQISYKDLYSELKFIEQKLFVK